MTPVLDSSALRRGGGRGGGGGVCPHRPPTWAGSCAGPPVSEYVSPPLYLPRNGFQRNYEIPSDLLFKEMVRNGIPTFLIFRGMVRNGIPRVFRSAKQTEFRRNESKFPSVPCSAE
jgi:hypothetical protein